MEGHPSVNIMIGWVSTENIFRLPQMIVTKFPRNMFKNANVD